MVFVNMTLDIELCQWKLYNKYTIQYYIQINSVGIHLV